MHPIIVSLLVSVLIGVAALPCAAAVIPQPVKQEAGEGCFVIAPDTGIYYAADAPEGKRLAAYAQAVLTPATGYAFPVAAADGAAAGGILLKRLDAASGLGKEGYRLKVEEDGVVIAAPEAAGLFYGIQTLRQLLPPEIFSPAPVTEVAWRIPCQAIEDQPRFVWRGMMLDVARHFMPKAFVFKCIDALALHKMNSLQLHLTDDQGWRIEIKQYPKLTEVGAWRAETVVGHASKAPQAFDGKRHGGFYTQADIRDIVAYAQSRFVNIVPEIEMPGHAQAAIAAYPALGNTDELLPVHTSWGVNKNIFNAEEATIAFLQDVLTEVIDLFPSPFIHVGGDEAVKDQWESSPAAQARIQELGLEDEDALQSYIIRRMDAFLTEKGRRLIGWDEILEGGLAEGATVMSWRGMKGGIKAAQAGQDVVMAPTMYTYFDYYQGKKEEEPLAIGGFLPLRRVYKFDPIPEELSPKEAKHILGAQGQLWTEYIGTPEYLEYMAWPRLCALAEVCWTPQEARDFKAFEERLATHLQRFDHLGIGYRPLD